MDVVSSAILDVALSKQPASIALNLVHPRPLQWSSIIGFLADAMLHAGVASYSLPSIAFQEWFERLEKRSQNASADEMTKIVSFNEYDDRLVVLITFISPLSSF